MNTEKFRPLAKEFSKFSEQDKIEAIGILLKLLKSAEPNQIPIGIFDSSLSSLEAIVKYLKENLEMKFSKIARLLSRDNRAIWSTYRNAAKKMPSSFSDLRTDIAIPASIFADRKLSILENLVNYLKGMELTNHEIAVMLKLNDRTIWSVYSKVKLKRGMK
ncbi:hypothetical protein HYU10_03535 [Candidatus Woesearchaeota archaeon]|nr:hypothetical protein [Candidatus Woesearchaeota archaeon]MBI2130817.1 hypothetical protein [Candidatus Woesearchaeota archaeon]MBI2661428.1 hypothetical protein [Candidatus Woesearchaeota archaeon]